MVIVTGATGHIGNALVRELHSRKVAVRALVLPNENIDPIGELPIEIARGDVTDYDSLLKAFDGITCVYHLAGIVNIGIGKRGRVRKVNVEGTRNVVQACLEKKIPRLVYTSSIHAFEELPRGQIRIETKEFDSKKVKGHYAKSKAAATNIVLKGVEKGLNAVIVHPTGVIGPYEFKLTNMGQVVVDFLKRKLFAYVDGTYDFVDVRDVANGIILAGEKGRTGENYILSGEQISVKQIMEMLQNITGLKAPKIKLPLWFAKWTAPLSELYYKLLRQQPLYTSYSLQVLCSNSLTSYNKAYKELGYKPRPIHEAISGSVHWIKNHMHLLS
ncbi:SDR family oxidoreductase [bacterium]|nr:SDR family oxidoreductase [bacterium]